LKSLIFLSNFVLFFRQGKKKYMGDLQMIFEIYLPENIRA